MQAKVRIKKGDTVIVLAGKDRGKTGKVQKVLRQENRVVVEGVNMVARHQKPSAAHAGGVVRVESPVHLSNVAYYDQELKKASRIGYRMEDNVKVRFSKKSGKKIEA